MAVIKGGAGAVGKSEKETHLCLADSQEEAVWAELFRWGQK